MGFELNAHGTCFYSSQIAWMNSRNSRYVTYLNHSLGAADFEDLSATFGAVRQRECHNLCILGKLVRSREEELNGGWGVKGRRREIEEGDRGVPIYIPIASKHTPGALQNRERVLLYTT